MLSAKNKTVLLGMPESYGISHVIKIGLEANGFNVINISFDADGFKYRNIAQRIRNWFHKNVKKDYSYKSYLKFLPSRKLMEGKINSIPRFDYALLIRADIYPEYLIKIIRSKTEMFVAYQWDGLSKYPVIMNYIPYFDRFCIFDKDDIDCNCNYIPITNFYIKEGVPNNNGFKKTKILFFGGYYKSRREDLKRIKNYLNECQVDCDILLYSKMSIPSDIIALGIQRLDEPIQYADYLELASGYDVFVDITVEGHNGLSFRAFEALGMSKKLITTNSSIKEYDFYVEDNIFVVHSNNMDRLSSFLEKPYIPVADNIRKKYSISSWVNNILNVDTSKQ